MTETEKKFHELWMKTRDLTSGEETTDLIDELSVFLLRLFLNQRNVLTKHLAQMKTFFGEITNKQANDIHSIVKQITQHLDDVAIDGLKKLASDDEEMCNEERKLFGSTIKYLSAKEYFQDTSFLRDLMPPIQSFTPKGTVEKFSMKYDEKIEFNEPSTNSDKIYDRNWMIRHINNELIDLLIGILKSSRSNEELQNELFDLLGFDKFELILEILENRKSILKNMEMTEKRELMKEQIIKRQQENMTKPAPNYLMPVLVQSEKERDLMKMARKDEKKLRELNNKLNGDDDEDEEVQLAKLQLSQSNSMLRIAQKAPVLTESKSSAWSSIQRFAQAPPKYPNVYDSNKDARAHVGFLSGNKILLPENTSRRDTQMYEEVTIPARETPSDLEVGNNRVKVESLDEIGKIVFKGTKELNRIQTIVYPTAYHTNENLLICAPTGAG